jgi:hypothetical protein
VHNIAKEHGFFNPEGGTSVQINPGDHITIGADGNIHLSADHTDFVQAPENAHVTPAYHPNAETHVAAPHAETPIAPKVEAPAAPVVESAPSHPEAPTRPAESPTAQTVEAKTMPVTQEHPATVETRAPTAETHTPAEASTPPSPVESAVHETVTNHFGLKIPMSEPHIYADGAKHIFVYGGSPDAQADVVKQYFADPSHANNIIYGTDTRGAYRIPWHVAEGKVFPGAPIRTSGFLGFFKSFMKAPEPDELEKIIQ